MNKLLIRESKKICVAYSIKNIDYRKLPTREMLFSIICDHRRRCLGNEALVRGMNGSNR